MTKTTENEIKNITEEEKLLYERRVNISKLQEDEFRLSEINNQIKEFGVYLNDLELNIKSGRGPELQLLKEEHKQLSKKIDKLKENATFLEAEIKALNNLLPGEGKIDKHQVLKNIRVLMRLKDVKVGQVEKEAGCSTGYMSRLEREGNTTAPTLEFVATAAEMLGVSMDVIVRGNIEDVTPTDIYMLEFLSALLLRTESGEIAWSREDLDLTANPFMTVDYLKPKDELSAPRATGRSYKSLFDVGAVTNCEESPALCATLPGSEGRIYIIPVKCDFQTTPVSPFAEVYIVDKNGNRTPLYNTFNCNRALDEATGILFQAAEESARKVQLSDTAKTIIDQFMATRKKGDNLHE